MRESCICFCTHVEQNVPWMPDTKQAARTARAREKLVPRPVCLPAAHEGSAKSVDDGGGESASSRALQELPHSCFSTDYNKTNIPEYSAATIKTMGHLPGDGQVHRETFPVILTGSAILAVRTREVLRPLARPPKPSLRFCKEKPKSGNSAKTKSGITAKTKVRKFGKMGFLRLLMYALRGLSDYD